MKKKYLLCAFLWLCALTSHAQSASNIQRLNIKSPEVAAFTKVGDIPVSLYTGVPQISIPIYEVKNGSLSLPITLDYQATAVQVNQEATWVGLNWLLNAGGVVTTQVTKPDAGTLKDDWRYLYNKLPLTSIGNNDLGQLYRMNGCHEMNWRGVYGYNRFRNVRNPQSPDLSFELYAKMLDNHEGEAQCYSANFMGHSFEFIYHPLQEKFIVIGKEKKYKIEGGGTGFTKITDADGVEYGFGIVEVNAPEAYTNAPYLKRSTSFYLTQIKHPDGRTIYLRYKQHGSIRMLPEVTETWFYNFPNKANYNVEKELTSLVKINNYYLSEIVTDDVTVTFNTGTRTDLQGGRKLESIEVKDKSGNVQRRFRFAYNYFKGNGVGGNRLYDYYNSHNQLNNYNSLYSDAQINNRLQLVSLHEEAVEDGKLHKLPPYRFAYNNNLPGKSSSARDYWGYFNGKNNRTLCVKRAEAEESGYNSFPYSSTVATGDRRCNPQSITAGLLTAITYPTGGVTALEYEPHSFTNFTYLNTLQTGTFPTLSLHAVSTNTNDYMPSTETEPRDFTTDQEMEVEVSVSYYCPTTLYWREMLGSAALLIAYKTVNTSNGTSVQTYPYKVWALSPSDTLTAQNGYAKRKEKIMLPAGKYQLKCDMSAPQIAPYPHFPGSRRVDAQLKTTGVINSYGGGVRIKEIRQTDGNGQTLTIRYDYNQAGGTSTGILMTPLHFVRKKMQVYQTEQKGTNAYLHTATLKEYWMASSSDMTPARGIAVGYSQVGVERGDGKTVYEFWNRRITNVATEYCPPLPDPRNGDILKESVYSQAGQLKKETVNSYTVLKKEHHFVNALVEDIYYGPDAPISEVVDGYATLCGGGRMMFCIYPSSVFQIERTRQVVREYIGKDTVEVERKYTYNPWNLKTATMQTCYKPGESETLHYLYPQNYANTGSSYPGTLTAKHILNPPLEIVRIADRDGAQTVIAAELNRYNNNGQPVSHSNLKLSKPLAAGSFKFSNKTAGVIGTDTLNQRSYSPSSGYLADVTCTYTTNGNLATVTEKQNLTTVYLWSYGKQHLIAEIANTTLEEVKKALGYTTDAQLAALESEAAPDVNAIRQKLDAYFKGSQALVTTYTYKPFAGITSKTEPNGNVTYYEYDALGRLTKVTDRNGKTVQRFEYHYKNQ